MRLSDDIKKWRAERPDEWTMDRFYLEALRLEAVEEKVLQSDNKRMVQGVKTQICPECNGDARYVLADGLTINCVECHGSGKLHHA